MPDRFPPATKKLPLRTIELKFVEAGSPLPLAVQLAAKFVLLKTIVDVPAYKFVVSANNAPTDWFVKPLIWRVHWAKVGREANNTTPQTT
jgi:hypothetical protein